MSRTMPPGGTPPGRADRTAAAISKSTGVCQGWSWPGPPMGLSVSAAMARYEYSGCSAAGTSPGVTRLLMRSGKALVMHDASGVHLIAERRRPRTAVRGSRRSAPPPCCGRGCGRAPVPTRGRAEDRSRPSGTRRGSSRERRGRRPPAAPPDPAGRVNLRRPPAAPTPPASRRARPRGRATRATLRRWPRSPPAATDRRRASRVWRLRRWAYEHGQGSSVGRLYQTPRPVRRRRLRTVRARRPRAPRRRPHRP